MLRLELGSRRLVASGWMSVLALAAVLLFAQLGRWQWHRAAEKTALAAAFAGTYTGTWMNTTFNSNGTIGAVIGYDPAEDRRRPDILAPRMEASP